MSASRQCETCQTPIFGPSRKRRFCLSCGEQRIRDAKAKHELIRQPAMTRPHRNYPAGHSDLSTVEIERIIRREAQIKRQTGWRPAGWSYGFVKP